MVSVADYMVVRRKKISFLKNFQENLTVCQKYIFKVRPISQDGKRDLENKGIPLLPSGTVEKDRTVN
ncbi:MAG: hypothetical protein DRI57_08390 [Deltaproteobacteria bacterium]|nr:MAG: hypothetical protein DRI57_08390 [Deltaproteobacteria bacterium]